MAPEPGRTTWPLRGSTTPVEPGPPTVRLGIRPQPWAPPIRRERVSAVVAFVDAQDRLLTLVILAGTGRGA